MDSPFNGPTIGHVPLSKLVPANESPYTDRNLTLDCRATMNAILADPEDREAFFAPLARNADDYSRNLSRTEVWKRRFALQSLARVTHTGVNLEEDGHSILVTMTFPDGRCGIHWFDRESDGQRR